MLQSYRVNTVESLIESSLANLGISMMPAPSALTADQKATLKPQVVKTAVLIAFFGGVVGKSEFCRLTQGVLSLRKAARVVGWCSGSVHMARKAMKPLTRTEYALTWAPSAWLSEVVEAAHARTPRPRRASDALPPRFLLNPPKGA